MVAIPPILASDPAKNAAIDAQCALADGGTIEFQDAADTPLCIIALDTPAFGAAVGGVADAAGLPKGNTSILAGTIDHYVIRDAGATELWRGTVGVVGDLAPFNMYLTSNILPLAVAVAVVELKHEQVDP